MIKKKVTKKSPSKSNATAKDYIKTLVDLKEQVQTAQVKAVLSANKELIKLYWSIGKTITEKQEKSNWGSGLIEERLAQDLQGAFPGISGFSKLNIFRMQVFYRAYEKVSQPVTQLENQSIVSPLQSLSYEGIKKLLACLIVSFGLLVTSNAMEFTDSKDEIETMRLLVGDLSLNDCAQSSEHQVVLLDSHDDNEQPELSQEEKKFIKNLLKNHPDVLTHVVRYLKIPVFTALAQACKACRNVCYETPLSALVHNTPIMVAIKKQQSDRMRLNSTIHLVRKVIQAKDISFIEKLAPEDIEWLLLLAAETDRMEVVDALLSNQRVLAIMMSDDLSHTFWSYKRNRNDYIIDKLASEDVQAPVFKNSNELVEWLGRRHLPWLVSAVFKYHCIRVMRMILTSPVFKGFLGFEIRDDDFSSTLQGAIDSAKDRDSEEFSLRVYQVDTPGCWLQCRLWCLGCNYCNYYCCFPCTDFAVKRLGLKVVRGVKTHVYTTIQSSLYTENPEMIAIIEQYVGPFGCTACGPTGFCCCCTVS